MPPTLLPVLSNVFMLDTAIVSARNPLWIKSWWSFDRTTNSAKMKRVHPLDQLLLSLRDGHQIRVIWHVVSAPMARDDYAQRERGDNTSAVGCKYLFEEVNHVGFLLRFTSD